MNPNWWRDERFWRDIRPFLFPGSLMDSGDQEADDIVDELDLSDGARILDIGCGPGRILVPLAQRGFQVVGLDTCAEYRRQARALAQRRELEIDVRPGDVFELELGDTPPFDAVLDVFAVIGYHAEPVFDVVAARQMRTALRPGGQLMIQTRRPANTTGTFKHRAPSGGICVEIRRYDRTTKTMSTAWTISHQGRHRVYESSVRVYEREDIVGLLDFCEFVDIRSYEAPNEERLVVIGERPAEPAGPDS